MNQQLKMPLNEQALQRIDRELQENTHKFRNLIGPSASIVLIHHLDNDSNGEAPPSTKPAASQPLPNVAPYSTERRSRPVVEVDPLALPRNTLALPTRLHSESQLRFPAETDDGEVDVNAVTGTLHGLLSPLQRAMLGLPRITQQAVRTLAYAISESRLRAKTILAGADHSKPSATLPIAFINVQTEIQKTIEKLIQVAGPEIAKLVADAVGNGDFDAALQSSELEYTASTSAHPRYHTPIHAYSRSRTMERSASRSPSRYHNHPSRSNRGASIPSATAALTSGTAIAGESTTAHGNPRIQPHPVEVYNHARYIIPSLNSNNISHAHTHTLVPPSMGHTSRSLSSISMQSTTVAAESATLSRTRTAHQSNLHDKSILSHALTTMYPRSTVLREAIQQHVTPVVAAPPVLPPQDASDADYAKNHSPSRSPSPSPSRTPSQAHSPSRYRASSTSDSATLAQAVLGDSLPAAAPTLPTLPPNRPNFAPHPHSATTPYCPVASLMVDGILPDGSRDLFGHAKEAYSTAVTGRVSGKYSAKARAASVHPTSRPAVSNVLNMGQSQSLSSTAGSRTSVSIGRGGGYASGHGRNGRSTSLRRPLPNDVQNETIRNSPGNLSYYKMQQVKYGRARRGSNAIAGIWAEVLGPMHMDPGAEPREGEDLASATAGSGIPANVAAILQREASPPPPPAAAAPTAHAVFSYPLSSNPNANNATTAHASSDSLDSTSLQATALSSDSLASTTSQFDLQSLLDSLKSGATFDTLLDASGTANHSTAAAANRAPSDAISVHARVPVTAQIHSFTAATAANGTDGANTSTNPPSLAGVHGFDESDRQFVSPGATPSENSSERTGFPSPQQQQTAVDGAYTSDDANVQKRVEDRFATILRSHLETLSPLQAMPSVPSKMHTELEVHSPVMGSALMPDKWFESPIPNAPDARALETTLVVDSPQFAKHLPLLPASTSGSTETPPSKVRREVVAMAGGNSAPSKAMDVNSQNALADFDIDALFSAAKSLETLLATSLKDI